MIKKKQIPQKSPEAEDDPNAGVFTERIDPTDSHFPIVGIGASAGGLAAFEAFFSGMPADSDPGMAFVLVQHLAPDHKSILTDLIGRYTRMEAFEVEDGMVVRKNCAYIIPPNRDMAFINGTLQLMEPSAPRGKRLPIDFFFRSLATDQRDHAIAIVLSGTGSDGTLGVRAVKGEGGMVMVQTPETTEYDGMPRNAIATGLVDFVLQPAEMAARLIDYASNAFSKPIYGAESAPVPAVENALKKIFILLRTKIGHDFSKYKPSTINRRIERRMALLQIETIESYFRYLQDTPEEVEALFRDFLIGVTSFFRDPDAFKAFEDKIIPDLFSGKNADDTIRVWVPGCSTGEEAYSIAMLIQEYLEEQKKVCSVQIFATDIDSQAIATARAGLYPDSIATDISPKRLTRFFNSEPDGSAYRINKKIRDKMIFSEQDIIKDPPFSKLDLISCRNLLIYMDEELQKQLIPLFHYALLPDGSLFLGSSESVGVFSDLFEVLDRKAKLYRRKKDLHGVKRITLGRLMPSTTAVDMPSIRAPRKTVSAQKMPLRELTERALLEETTPSAALIKANGDILYLHGRTGKYLEPVSGEAGVNNILKMAREGLQRDLTTALHKAVRTDETVHHSGLRIRTNGDYVMVNLTVRPVPVETGITDKNQKAVVSDEPLYLAILDEVRSDAAHPAPLIMDDPDKDTDLRIIALRQEMLAKEEYLQATREELETSNEELKTSNEEMQSINEELQSTNEELETSKEELQSVNEELATVNAELQVKVADLMQTSNDMNNLIAGTGIATIFVNLNLEILRFTPEATRIINLIVSDIGRPVAHILSNLVGYDSLVDDAQSVLDTLIPKEMDVQSKDGRWYRLRILPYRTLNNVIEGVVLTFVDITTVKNAQDEIRLNQERMRIGLSAFPIVVYNQDLALRYTWIFSTNPEIVAEKMLGRTDAEMVPEEEATKLTAIKQQVIERGEGTRQEIQSTHDGRSIRYDLTIEPLRDTRGALIGITCASLEITGCNRKEGIIQ